MKITKPVALAASAVIVVALGVGVAAWVPKSTTTKTSSQPTTSQQATKPIDHLDYDGQDGKTAMDILKTKATVVTKSSSYGAYVDSIDGVAGGSNGKYWTLYVNGDMSQVGADAYTTKTGDKIEWKLQ